MLRLLHHDAGNAYHADCPWGPLSCRVSECTAFDSVLRRTPLCGSDTTGGMKLGGRAAARGNNMGVRTASGDSSFSESIWQRLVPWQNDKRQTPAITNVIAVVLHLVTCWLQSTGPNYVSELSGGAIFCSSCAFCIFQHLLRRMLPCWQTAFEVLLCPLKYSYYLDWPRLRASGTGSEMLFPMRTGVCFSWLYRFLASCLTHKFCIVSFVSPVSVLCASLLV